MLNTAAGTVSGTVALAMSGLVPFPGIFNDSVASLSVSGLSVVSTLAAPFGVLFGNGVFAQAHGTQTNQDTQNYSTNFTSLLPASGSITAYLLASYQSIQQNAYQVVGAQPGSPDYDPSFIPYTAYATQVDSLALTASTTAADNLTTFELGRGTLSSGATGIAGFTTAFQQPARSYGIFQSIETYGNISAPSWTVSGIRAQLQAATFTDITLNATVPAVYANSFGAPTFVTSSPATYNNAYTSFFAMPSSPGSAATNPAIGFGWSLGGDAANFATVWITGSSQLYSGNWAPGGAPIATRGYGIYIKPSVGSYHTGSLYNATVLYVGNFVGSGIATQYGVFVDNLTSGVSNFAIYTSGSAPSQFGGAITSLGTISGSSFQGGSANVGGISGTSIYIPSGGFINAVTVSGSVFTGGSISNTQWIGNLVINGTILVSGVAENITVASGYINVFGTGLMGDLNPPALAVVSGTVQAPFFLSFSGSNVNIPSNGSGVILVGVSGVGPSPSPADPYGFGHYQSAMSFIHVKDDDNNGNDVIAIISTIGNHAFNVFQQWNLGSLSNNLVLKTGMSGTAATLLVYNSAGLGGNADFDITCMGRGFWV